MSQGLGMLIDCVVAILLVMTIGYCMMLNRRLKLLKADEQSLRATISELITATEIAERAIGGLKITVHECDMGLGERLRKAERVAIEVDRSIAGGRELLDRLTQIVAAGRGGKISEPPEPAAPKPVPGELKAVSGARAVAAAAEAFAERLRTKVHGFAA